MAKTGRFGFPFLIVEFDVADSKPSAGSLEIERQSDGQYILTAKQRFAQSPETLFPFFSEARNLERITPPWLAFELLTPGPIEMGEGAQIDYRLNLHGIPIRWRSRIAAWHPPHRFVDEQVKGPYKRWHHQHILELDDAGGTTMIDRVTYAVPGGALIHNLLVGRDVRQIFLYRMARLKTLFGDG